MSGVLLACRLIVAGAFLVAAVAKLGDREGTRTSFREFGMPAGAVPVAVIAVPLAELAVAGALLPDATAVAAAWAAVGLLAVFTVAIARVIASGQEAECHCFGRVSSRPVGPGTLARNAVLIAMAVAVGIGGAGTSPTAWISDLSTTEAVLASVSAVLALGLAFNTAFLFQLFRQNGRLWAQLDELGGASPAARPSGGPEIGEVAPPIDAHDLAGSPVGLEDLLETLPDEDSSLLLLFVSPDCSVCDPLMPEIGRRQRDPGADPRPVVLAAGAPEDVAAKTSEHGIDSVFVIEGDFSVPQSFGVNGAPGAVVVDADGRIASSPAVGRTAVDELLEITSEPPELVHVDGAS